jgi:hypothetical protein
MQIYDTQWLHACSVRHVDALSQGTLTIGATFPRMSSRGPSFYFDGRLRKLAKKARFAAC